METIEHYSLSRTHFGLTNYLLITQHKIVKFDYKNAVKYDPRTNQMSVLPEYEVKEIKDNSEQAEDQLFKYLKDDAMSEGNAATKDYSYFRVVLANGRDIVCTGYSDFLKQYESK